jgi:uncharacterized protein YndB with AHSA1/START domain
MPDSITVETIVNLPVAKVWDFYNKPEHIVNWNQASEDWHTTKSEVDLRTGGKFSSRMEAKDGSVGFDFGGTYDEVLENQVVSYTMSDNRKVLVAFTDEGDQTRVSVTFDLENENTPELQRSGWQAILDSFKKYAESRA